MARFGQSRDRLDWNFWEIMGFARDKKGKKAGEGEHLSSVGFCWFDVAKKWTGNKVGDTKESGLDKEG